MSKKNFKKATMSVLALEVASNLIAPSYTSYAQNEAATTVTAPTETQVEKDKKTLNSSNYEKLDRKGWKATLTDSAGKKLGDEEVKKLFDGSTETFAKFEGQDKKEPFTLEIDLGNKIKVYGFSVDKRPGTTAGVQWGKNGTMKAYKIQAYTDSNEWQDVDSGVFTENDYKLYHEGKKYNNGKTVYKKFTKPVTAQRIKIIQESNHNVYGDHEFTSSEIDLYKLTEEAEYKTKYDSLLNLEIDKVNINHYDEVHSALGDLEYLSPEGREKLKKEGIEDKLNTFKERVTNLKNADDFDKANSEVLEAESENIDVEKLTKAIQHYNQLKGETKNFLKNKTTILLNLIKKIKEKGQGQDLPELKLTEEFKKKEEKAIIEDFLEKNKDLLEKEVDQVSPAEKEKIQELIKLLESLSQEEQEKLNDKKEKLKSFLAKIKQGEDEATTNQFKTEHKDILDKTEEQIKVSDKEKVEKALQAIESANEEVKASLAEEKEKLEKLKEKITELGKAPYKSAFAKLKESNQLDKIEEALKGLVETIKDLTKPAEDLKTQKGEPLTEPEKAPYKSAFEKLKESGKLEQVQKDLEGLVLGLKDLTKPAEDLKTQKGEPLTEPEKAPYKSAFAKLKESGKLEQVQKDLEGLVLGLKDLTKPAEDLKTQKGEALTEDKKPEYNIKGRKILKDKLTQTGERSNALQYTFAMILSAMAFGVTLFRRKKEK